MIHLPCFLTPIIAASLAVIAVATLGSCGGRSTPDDPLLSVGEIEQLFWETRALGDQIDVTRSRGETTATTGVALGDLIGSYNSVRTQLQRSLSVDPASPASEEDLRALSAMRRALEIDLPEESNEPTSAAVDAGGSGEVDCRYDPETVANGEGGYEALSKRIYTCFSEAARSLSFEGEPMDRLTVFGRLPLTDEPSRRERLWSAMAPIWASVNGDNGPRSPYRTLIRLNAARMQSEGEVLGESVRGIGVEPAVMEKWLMEVLQKWHDITPDTAIEPWDFAYNAGRGNRALSDAIPVESLRVINDRFYRDLGADPVALQVRYDLEPRPSKDPVAFATFGRRPLAARRAVGLRVLPDRRARQPLGASARDGSRDSHRRDSHPPGLLGLAGQRHLHRGNRRHRHVGDVRTGVATALPRGFRVDRGCDRRQIRGDRDGHRLGAI
jgi:hypothetical protein